MTSWCEIWCDQDVSTAVVSFSHRCMYIKVMGHRSQSRSFHGWQITRLLSRDFLGSRNPLIHLSVGSSHDYDHMVKFTNSGLIHLCSVHPVISPLLSCASQWSCPGEVTTLELRYNDVCDLYIDMTLQTHIHTHIHTHIPSSLPSLHTTMSVSIIMVGAQGLLIVTICPIPMSVHLQYAIANGRPG